MYEMMGKWGEDEKGWRKGPWTPEEDRLLLEYVAQFGEGRWSSVCQCTGLNRSGKSSRLRWVNYLRPGLKKGRLTPQEEGIVIELHALWGNKWATIARYLPGRTDNEIKNYWRTHFKKRTKRPDSKQEKRKALHEENEEYKNNASEITQTAATEAIGGLESEKQEIENEEAIVPGIYIEEEYYENVVGAWSSGFFTPQDCYLWGGLWNFS